MVPESDHAGLAGSGLLPEVHLQARVGGRVGGGVRDGARQPRGGVGELAAAQQLGPLQQGRGDVAVVHEQVPRLLVAVHARVGQAVAEVVEVAVQEDRVVGAPQDEGGHVGATQGGEVLAHPLQFGMAAVAGVGRDVRDEAADAAASGRRVVGQVVGGPGLAVEGRGGEGGRHGQEGVRGDGGGRQDGPGEGGLQRGGDRRPLGLVDRGVQGRDAGHQLRMTRRPAEGHDAAPVVAERDQRVAGGCQVAQPESRQQGVQVGDAAAQRAVGVAGTAHRRGGRGARVREALGEAHV
ncbi:Uncharacterised protein [Streptococcus pneumoniae]|nr:Uncharacterised protein [Streptococcus pneumoniae]